MHNCKFYRIENNELFNIIGSLNSGDIIYIRYEELQIPNVWNGFRIFYEGKLYSIGGNPSIREIDYKIYEEENDNISNLSVIDIPDSDITDILKRNDYSEEEIELLRFIQNCNYSETFINEKKRYDIEYQKQLIEENDIWDTYGELSPSKNELDLLIGQLEKIRFTNFN